MAILHGKKSHIWWDSETTDTEMVFGQSWTLSVTHDIAESTSMQDTWKTYWTGFQDWTATVNCLLPLEGSPLPLETDGTPLSIGDVTTARLELYVIYDTVPETDVFVLLYGEAFVSGIEYGGAAGGVGTVNYTFQGSGQMQWASGATRP